MAQIATRNNPRRVELSGGGAVLVRRVGLSTKAAIASAVNLSSDNQASLLRFQLDLLRAGVVGCEGLVSIDTGEPVRYRADKVRGLGDMAALEVIDAIPEEDIARVTGAISGDAVDGDGEGVQAGSDLTAGQAGN